MSTVLRLFFAQARVRAQIFYGSAPPHAACGGARKKHLTDESAYGIMQGKQKERNMKELLIIGSGPAGISAALYAVRGGAPVTIAAKDGGALEKAERIQNYYGFADGVDAKALLAAGVEQAQKLGAKLRRTEVFGVEFTENGFRAKTAEGFLDAGAIVLACGTARSAPPIRNLKTFEGAGISYCAVCDAFFYRGKKVAVVGGGAYARSEFEELKNVVENVTVLTNGDPALEGIPCKTEKLASFEGDERLKEVVFADGSREQYDGVFIACGSAGAFELAKKIGIASENGKLLTDERHMTNVPGIFAAGDCTPGMQQIAKAVCDGMIAGTEALRYLKAQHWMNCQTKCNT